MAHTKLNTFHLFAGAGGGILADVLLGHNPIGACEIEPYPRDVLLARQADGHLPDFPIWDDVATLDGNPWRGSVDVLCGGFPCQDISSAGKGAGITGERSGLWKEYARLIGEMRPRFVFAENSPLLRTRGLGVVLEDLAALGYNARWGIIGAGAVGAPHKRDRMWVLAYTNNDGNPATEESQGTTQGSNSGQTRSQQTSEFEGLCSSRTDGCMEGLPANVAYTTSEGLEGFNGNSSTEQSEEPWAGNSRSESGNGFWHTDPAEVGDAEMLHAQGCADGSGQGELGRASERDAQGEADRATEPAVGRVAHGVANRVDRLKAIGNGQVPQCAAVAFNILSEGLL